MSRHEDLRVPTLHEALEATTIPDLRPIAASLQAALPTRKADLVAVVEGYLRDPANLRGLLAKLDDLGRAAVSEAVHDDGSVHRQAFEAKYGGLPDFGNASRLALLFYGDLRIPDDLSERLRPMVPRPAPAQIQGLAELPPADADAEDGVRVRLTEHAAQADLTALLRVCDSGKLRCSETTRRPSAATVKAVTAVLDEGDFYAETPIAAFAWPLLVQAGGLAEIAGGRLQLTARGRRALQAPAPETLKHLWNRWLDHGLIDEFSRVEAIKGQQASGGRNLTAVPPRRRAVAAALAGAPPQRWIAVDGFFAFMQAAGHDFAVVRDTWHLYIGDPQYGNFGYAGYGDWSVIQGRFVLCLLLEFAATLGLIDVAYVDPTWARDDYRDQWGTDDLDALSRYDGLRFFRVNALGAYCVGRAEHYQPSPQIAASGRPILRLLPNLDLVFTGRRLPAADALLLERYTEVRSAGVWTLRREKLLAAVARGEGPQELEQFLRERTEPPLPDTAADLLAEVRERAGRLSDLGAVRLVECADANLALLLAHDRRLRGHCRLFGERHLAVPAEHEERFRQALWEVGYALPPAGAGGSAGAARP